MLTGRCRGKLLNEQRELDGTVPKVQIISGAVMIHFGCQEKKKKKLLFLHLCIDINRATEITEMIQLVLFCAVSNTLGISGENTLKP